MECGQALGMCTFPLALIHKKSHPQVSKYYNVSLNFYERFGDLWGLFFWGPTQLVIFPYGLSPTCHLRVWQFVCTGKLALVTIPLSIRQLLCECSKFTWSNLASLNMRIPQTPNIPINNNIGALQPEGVMLSRVRRISLPCILSS